ncbi:MAG: tRNA (N(6)-L-threonylcarbamoyladenosine(37)-C(2))-methylthiotransferase [Nitrososphaerota archaeon]
MHLRKVYLESYGCSANLADSEIMGGLLQRAGYEISSSPQESDVNIIVTCTVKTSTANRMVHRLKQLSRLGKPLVVAGCMPLTERYAVEKIHPSASLLGPDSITKVVECVEATVRGEKKVILDRLGPKLLLPRIRHRPIVGIVEISSGCLDRCSFCQVKLARADLVSYPPEAIVKEVEEAVRDGCKEIWLTSQDNGCYGKDIGTSLAELLRQVCEVKGDFWVRVGMMNPTHVKDRVDEFLDAYAHEKVFKFLHLPVQSGSDRLLRLMNRRYTVKDFLNIVERFRQKFPQVTLSTDIIVGFPTEGEDDFELTMKLIKTIEPDVVNLSKFGSRPGTVAAKMPQVDPNTIKERSLKLHRLIKEASLKKNRSWIGWRGEALVDEMVKGAWLARNFAYKPILLYEGLALGEKVSVEVIDATANCLVGKVLERNYIRMSDFVNLKSKHLTLSPIKTDPFTLFPDDHRADGPFFGR